MTKRLSVSLLSSSLQVLAKTFSKVISGHISEAIMLSLAEAGLCEKGLIPLFMKPSGSNNVSFSGN